MPHLEEGEIHAWLDGAADEVEAARIEAHVASCERCAAEVATARGLIAGASRILLSLDSVPGGVIPRQDTKRPVARHSAWFSRPLVRIAASLMLVAGVGVVATRNQRSADDQVTIEFRTAAVGADSTAASGPAPETPPMSTGVAATAASAEADRSALRSEQASNRTAVSASSGPAGARGRSEARLPLGVIPVDPSPAAPQKSAPSPPVVGDVPRADGGSFAGASGDLAQRRVARDSVAAGSRLSEVVVTGAATGAQDAAAAAPTARQLQLRAPEAGFGGLAGACFALDVKSAPGAAGIPLLPTRMRIRLANAATNAAPAVALESRLQRSEANTANVQAGAAAARQAGAPAPRTYAAPTSEPAEPLPWMAAAGDSLVAYWGTATDVVTFRLQVRGEVVTGSAVAQLAQDRPSTVEGRRIICGGG